jgi:decaprenyl-phosphate phosphoribosyltransferase
LLALVRTLRPQQWVKNVFVAAPLVFARHLTDRSYLWREAVAVLAFCMLSGAVYAFNDVLDIEADRAHPTKKFRPIAAGALSKRAALVTSGVLATVALGACLALHWQLAVFGALYFALNLAYSVKLKHVAFLDVLMIATFFVLRVLAGAAAIAVPASEWLLACSGLLALYLALGKRAHELAWAQTSGKATTTTRAALAGYRLSTLRIAMLAIGLATAAAYVAYTLDHRRVVEFGTDRLVYSAPFVFLALVRFAYLAVWRPKDESPTEAMLRDPWFLLDLAAATATVLYIIYG